MGSGRTGEDVCSPMVFERQGGEGRKGCVVIWACVVETESETVSVAVYYRLGPRARLDLIHTRVERGFHKAGDSRGDLDRNPNAWI